MQVAAENRKAREKQERGEGILCPRCHAEVPAGSRYCNMCGISLQQKSPPAAANVVLARESSGKPPADAEGAVSRESTSRTANQHPGRPSPQSEALERAVKFILGHQNIPAFSHHIIKVMSLMGNDETSLRHLTNTILNDYSLTLAVLRRANSAYYNRSGKPICSVARAVTMMGVDAIKSLAGGLMLLENYARHSSGLKELLLLSMLTANHARQMAQQLKIKESEEAYVCGMFRNLGEILVACHLGEAYDKILREINDQKQTEHSACMKVLEFSYEDLGRAIAGGWNLPGLVKRVMENVDPSNYSRQSGEEKIGTVVAFSHALTTCIYRQSQEDRSQSIDRLLDKFSSIASLSRKLVQEVLAETVKDTKETFDSAGVPLDDLQLQHQYQLALSGALEPKATGSAALAAVTAPVRPENTPVAAQDQMPDEELLNRLAGEVRAAAEMGSELKLNEVIMMALEACHRGARFERVVFCLATLDRSMARGRLGLGTAIDDVIEQLQIPLSGHAEPLTLALLTRRDLFIDARNDDRFQDSNLVRALQASCFGLYPVVVEDRVVGCLYFDRQKPGPPPAQSVLQAISQLRDTLAEAIHRSRAGC